VVSTTRSSQNRRNQESVVGTGGHRGAAKRRVGKVTGVSRDLLFSGCPNLIENDGKVSAKGEPERNGSSTHEKREKKKMNQVQRELWLVDLQEETPE